MQKLEIHLGKHITDYTDHTSMDIVQLDDDLAALDSDYDGIECTYKGKECSLHDYLNIKFGKVCANKVRMLICN